MNVKLIESNPLVEETRNQVTVKRGPVVYCVESLDVPGASIFSLAIPSQIKLSPRQIKIENSDVVSLEGEARLIEDAGWKNQLYKEVTGKTPTPTHIRLVPYYAWGNRGHSEMSVWMPLIRN